MRFRECQKAVVIDLNDLISKACDAGWDRSEIIRGLIDLLEAEHDDADQLLQQVADHMLVFNSVV
jgi:hypothetical protein